MQVQCPVGWKIVGADVDSQEQWIAAIIGDSVSDKPKAGATPFSHMLLAGEKAKKTDLHSVVAREVGISRDNAKVAFNFLPGKITLTFISNQKIYSKITKKMKTLFQAMKTQHIL
jgi:hypothetical protein